MADDSKLISNARCQTTEPALIGDALKDVEEPSSPLSKGLARTLDILLIAGPLVHFLLSLRGHGLSKDISDPAARAGLLITFLLSALPFSILLLARVCAVSAGYYALLILSAGGMVAFDLYVNFAYKTTGFETFTIPIFIQLPLALFVLLLTWIFRAI
jgi:hypothetical protein